MISEAVDPNEDPVSPPPLMADSFIATNRERGVESEREELLDR